MSLEERTAAREFGRNRRQSARGAFILALLGFGAILALDRFLNRPHSPAAEFFRAARIPEWLPKIVGFACVAAVALYGYWRSVRSAPRFRLSKSGLAVKGALGTYTLECPNIREVAVTRAGALGIRVADRVRVLATHQGSPQQREWLRTTEPYGEWDFLFDQAELGVPAEDVVQWIQTACTGLSDSHGERSELLPDR